MLIILPSAALHCRDCVKEQKGLDGKTVGGGGTPGLPPAGAVPTQGPLPLCSGAPCPADVTHTARPPRAPRLLLQVLLVPPALRSGELLPLLEPYRHYRVWRLNFSGVGSTQRAYSGFSDQAAAEAFDRRMAAITTTWCCR